MKSYLWTIAVWFLAACIALHVADGAKSSAWVKPKEKKGAEDDALGAALDLSLIHI